MILTTIVIKCVCPQFSTITLLLEQQAPPVEREAYKPSRQENFNLSTIHEVDTPATTRTSQASRTSAGMFEGLFQSLLLLCLCKNHTTQKIWVGWLAGWLAGW